MVPKSLPDEQHGEENDERFGLHIKQYWYNQEEELGELGCPAHLFSPGGVLVGGVLSRLVASRRDSHSHADDLCSFSKNGTKMLV